jgi:putative transposase
MLGVYDQVHTKENTPMALDESALSELLDALSVGDGTDLIRDLAGWALQQLIEAEAAEVVGAGRFERSSDRVTHRNGHRRRVLSTKAGDLTVGIPKLRKGSFFPEILEPRRRIDQALYAVVMEAYVNGVSTRAVDDLVAAMGVAGARTHTPTHPPTHTHNTHRMRLSSPAPSTGEFTGTCIVGQGSFRPGVTTAVDDL